MLSGWTTTNLWEWFISPTFQISLLTLPQAIGINLCLSSMVASVLIKLPEKEDFKDKPYYALFHRLFLAVFVNLGVNGIGALYHAIFF